MLKTPFFFLAKGERCDFFKWLDPEMCSRLVEVIPWLLRHIGRTKHELELAVEGMKKIEEKSEKLKMSNQRLKAEIE